MKFKFRFNPITILEHIIVIEIYILLTIIAFHKLFILGFDKWVIGDHGDAWQFIWNFWWVKKVLTGENIFYTDYLFYPHGTHLYFHTLNLTGILIVFPLLFLTENLKLIYNVSVFLVFILSGYFMYLFLNYFLSRERKATRATKVISLLGGCMYAFSPYVVPKALGFFNLLSIQWFPLTLLLTFKLLEKVSIKRVISLSLLIIALFFTDFRYFYYYFIFTFFFFLFNFGKSKFRNFCFFCFSILCSLLILSFIYLPALFCYKTERQHYVIPYFQTITVYNYFLPSPFTVLYQISPTHFLSLYNLSENYMLVDSVVYYGIGYLILLVPLFLFSKRQELKSLYFLFALFLFSSLIALGTSNSISLFLNDILRKVLPFFDLLSTPSRHSFLAFLSLNLIICYLANIFLNKIKKKFCYLFILSLFILFFVEYFPFFFDSYYNVDVPKVIYEMSYHSENFTILNIPHNSNTQGMYLQTIHQKKILDGQVSRPDPNSIEVLEKIRSFIDMGYEKEILTILRENNVRYIILNHNYLPPYDLYFKELLLILKNRKIDSTKQIEVFEIIYS